jgi:hypothetical protein
MGDAAGTEPGRAAGRLATGPAGRLGSFTLGVHAAREFETSDPELADVLLAVSYLANRMS